MRIELHIDRVILDGVGVLPHHADAVREAVEVELARLLVASPARSWQQSRHRRRVSAPEVQQRGAAGLGNGAAGLGNGIALSVYGAVHHAD